MDDGGLQSRKEARGHVLSTLTGILRRLSVATPSVSLPDSRLVTVIRSTSLAPLDQSRSGLCQNRSRSAIGIILLSDWFWLATLIREQRWCVALSRASPSNELVGLRPSLRNLIIWLDYHHVLPPLDISPFYVYQIAIRYLRLDRLLTVFLISFRFVGFVLSLYSILYSIFFLNIRWIMYKIYTR